MAEKTGTQLPLYPELEQILANRGKTPAKDITAGASDNPPPAVWVVANAYEKAKNVGAPCLVFEDAIWLSMAEDILSFMEAVRVSRIALTKSSANLFELLDKFKAGGWVINGVENLCTGHFPELGEVVEPVLILSKE